MYKRQVFNITDGEASDSDEEELAQIAGRIRSLGTDDGRALLVNIHLASVSYTHLDVYKRQASAPWGSALLLPITYGYIKMLGGDGLRRATEMAIVNANYMSSALAAEYRTYYSGETGRVGHEMILDLTNFKHDYGIDCGDIAHRLMDYGFHAPTLSFPVHETLMVCLLYTSRCV